MSWTYDAANQPIQTVEQPGSPDAIVFRYTRDPMGRLLVRASEGSRAVFEYDAAGQLILGRTDNPPVEVRMAYDQGGRRISESVTAEDRSFAIQHAYDPLGNRLSTSLPDGTELGTTYYGCGNALQLSLGGATVTVLNAMPRTEISRTSRPSRRATTISRAYTAATVARRRAPATETTGGSITIRRALIRPKSVVDD